MLAMHLLLTAVTIVSQGQPPRPPHAPRPARPPSVSAAADLAAAAASLQTLVIPGVSPLVEQAQSLAGLAAGLEGLQGVEGLQGLEGLKGLEGLQGLEGVALAFDDDTPAPRPPVGWAQADPADSLWRAARRAFNRADYSSAADLYREIIRRYPRSTYTGDAHYWAAFALYKNGDLQQARTLLETQKSRFPRAATMRDGDNLYAQIENALAQQGDEPAIIWVRQHAAAPTAAASPAPAAGARAAASATSCPSGDDDDDVRMQALNGLLQMDADNAVPILKRVLQKRDACSASLRRKAVFLISQKRSDETEDVLLDVVQHDPDHEVRNQAVFWLSQVNTERAVGLLDSILRGSTDEELQEKALFALSQQNSPRAGAALRAFAERPGTSVEARGKAIFWLGQQHTDANAEYLRGLYAKLTDDELKNKVIFSLSQMGGAENMRWLMGIVLDEHEDVEMRKKALFWAGQSNESDLTQLTGLYDHMQNEEMKNQLIFVLSQRHEGAALDKLMDIARRETSRELRKKALFWIGQSHDPRAARFLEEIINQ